MNSKLYVNKEDKRVDVLQENSADGIIIKTCFDKNIHKTEKEWNGGMKGDKEEERNGGMKEEKEWNRGMKGEKEEER